MRKIFYAIISCLLVMFILFSIFHSFDLFQCSAEEGFVEGNKSIKRRANRPKDNVKRNVKARREQQYNYKYGSQVPANIPEQVEDDATIAAQTYALSKLTEQSMNNQAFLDNLYNNGGRV